MNKLMSLTGLWTGKGETGDGRSVDVRLEITPRFGGQVYEFLAEKYLDGTNKLIGGIAAFVLFRNGRLAEVSAVSSHLGTVVMCELPDDPEVLALKGEDANGGSVVTSVLPQSNDHIVITSHFRPHPDHEYDEVQIVNFSLHRPQVGR